MRELRLDDICIEIPEGWSVPALYNLLGPLDEQYGFLHHVLIQRFDDVKEKDLDAFAAGQLQQMKEQIPGIRILSEKKVPLIRARNSEAIFVESKWPHGDPKSGGVVFVQQQLFALKKIPKFFKHQRMGYLLSARYLETTFEKYREQAQVILLSFRFPEEDKG